MVKAGSNSASGGGAAVVVSRLLLLAAAAAAFVVAVVLSHQPIHPANVASERFVCPMHPQVTSPVAGDCPICNMALERVRQPATASLAVTPRIPPQEVRRRLVTQVVRVPAWLGDDNDEHLVTAVMHREELAGLSRGDHARFFRGADPANGILVHRTTDAAVAWDAATVAVRFRSSQPAMVEHETGWLQLDTHAKDLLVVPASAVLYSGDGPYVLASRSGEDRFARRFIQAGGILDSGLVAEQAQERLGEVVVLAGLDEGELVVSADTFFLDAEQRLQAAGGKAAEVVE